MVNSTPSAPPYGKEDVRVIQEKLNNRPRKSLKFMTPNEVIQREITPSGGALNP